MRSLLDNIRSTIEEFIDQRNDLIMLASCSDQDRPLVMKIIQDVEQATGTDLFLVFTHDFTSAGAFVDAAVRRLEEELKVACDALKEEGRAPLDPIPSGVLDPSADAGDRLRKMISYARSLVPPDGGHRLVWAMFPETLHDYREYYRLISSLVPWKGIEQWMRGVRLIFRYKDTDAGPLDTDKVPRTRLTHFDMGPPAIAGSIQKDVEDESLPVEDRMQSLYSLAVLDYAHDRTEDAMEKFRYLLGYFQSTKDDVMQAMVMIGIGDLYLHRKKDLDQARHWYECAVLPANASEMPVVMATVVRNLGYVAFEQKRYADAEQFFDNLDKLAAHLAEPETKARALEWRGLSQEKQNAASRAVESWESAAMLCRNVDMPDYLKPILEHLERIYKAMGTMDKANRITSELKQLERQEKAA